MSFPGEERYRADLAKAEGHESRSATIRVDDLKAALKEIDRLREENDRLRDFARKYVPELAELRS